MGDNNIHTTVNVLMSLDATRNNDTIEANNNVILYRRIDILTISYKESSIEASF